MSDWTRRGVVAATAAGLAGCGVGTVQTGSEIDQQVFASRAQLFASVPWAERLYGQSAGVLIVPQIVEGGFVVTGAYGEGALLVSDAPVDYMSMTAAAIGFQIGAQSFSQAIFFVTEEALADFRVTDGWELGLDAEAAVINEGIAAGTSTTTISRPVVAVVYGQRGLIAGASLEGAKYSRLIR